MKYFFKICQLATLIWGSVVLVDFGLKLFNYAPFYGADLVGILVVIGVGFFWACIGWKETDSFRTRRKQKAIIDLAEKLEKKSKGETNG